MEYVIGGFGLLLLLAMVIFAVRLLGKPKNLPKLPSVPRGAPVGKWKLVYDPAGSQIGLTHDFAESERARFIVCFVDDMLHYYQWGAAQYDTSREMREPLLRALREGTSDWKVTDATSHGSGGNSFDGELYESGITVTRVMGWSGQTDARPKGLAALVAHVVAGPDGPRAKKAIETLIDWYTAHGPTRPQSFDRSHAAWNNIAPLT